MNDDGDAGEGLDPLEGVTLLFVYNADSGLVSTLRDYVRKNVSPQTYQCNLCALTFGNLGMNNKWEGFIKDLGVPVEFLHRDQLRQTYGIDDIYLPAVFRKDAMGINLLIPAKDIDALWTLDELIGLVSLKVEEMRHKPSSSPSPPVSDP